jgi:HNH endonuclease
MLFEEDFLQRFWDKVTYEPMSGCWLWTGSKSTRYGTIHARRGDGSKTMLYAHRVSYAIHNNDLKKDNYVLHKCDNTYCCNPSHLMQGTQTDNMRDAAAKGRTNNRWMRATHCLRGHEFNEKNTLYKRIDENRVHRVCRICAREWAASKRSSALANKRTGL